jgi:hypothetical protein
MFVLCLLVYLFVFFLLFSLLLLSSFMSSSVIIYFSQLLRRLGGFFIKRKLEDETGQKDPLYNAVLQEVKSININETVTYLSACLFICLSLSVSVCLSSVCMYVLCMYDCLSICKHTLTELFSSFSTSLVY